MTNQIDERCAELVMDEEVREAVDDLRAIEKHSYAALLQRLAQRVKGLTAERDDAWRICATWRERAHAAEAKEIPEGHVAVPRELTEGMVNVISFWPGPWTEEGFRENFKAAIGNWAHKKAREKDDE